MVVEFLGSIISKARYEILAAIHANVKPSMTSKIIRTVKLCSSFGFKAIKELEKAGYIRTIKKIRKKQTANYYVLTDNGNKALQLCNELLKLSSSNNKGDTDE